MAFTGLPFPGLTMLGIVPTVLKEAVTVYTAEAIDTFQTPPEDQIAWIDDVATTMPADFVGKMPIDITALNGFQPFKGGERNYKQVDLTAVTIQLGEFDRPVEWPSKLVKAGTMVNVQNQGSAVVSHARGLKAELGATVIMQGVDTKNYSGSGTATTYPQPGFANGIQLFSSTNASVSNNGGHFVNPGDPNFGRFSNYFPASGKFTVQSFATMRTRMRTVPSPVTDRRTLGGVVTLVVGPSHMEEPFRQVALANLYAQVQTAGGNGVAAAVSNIYAAGSTPWKYAIAPQLDNHPFLQAYKAANPNWTPDTLPHCWLAVAGNIKGARGIGMAAPSATFMPRISVLGIGTEHEIKRKMVAIIPDMEAGAAPGIPHVVQWYEET